MICGPTNVWFYEQFFWYRKVAVSASVSLEKGLEPLHIPFSALVSATLVRPLELELRVLQKREKRREETNDSDKEEHEEDDELRTFVFVFASREDCSSWSIPLVRTLSPPIVVALPKDVLAIVTAYLGNKKKRDKIFVVVFLFFRRRFCLEGAAPYEQWYACCS